MLQMLMLLKNSIKKAKRVLCVFEYTYTVEVKIIQQQSTSYPQIITTRFFFTIQKAITHIFLLLCTVFNCASEKNFYFNDLG